MENQWYNKRLIPRKPSQRQLVLLSVLWPSLSKTVAGDSFRSFPSVNSKLSNVEKVDPAVVNRGLKTLVKVGYYQKQIDGKRIEDLSGPNKLYSETDYLSILKKLVTSLVPRYIIYQELRESNILQRYLRLCRYVELIRCKYIDLVKMLKVKRAIGPAQESEIEDYEKNYFENQRFLKQKSNKEIFLVASKLAVKELQERLWHADILYTRFFIGGGISYYS